MKPKNPGPKVVPTDRNRREANCKCEQAGSSYPLSQGDKFDVLLRTTMEGYWLVDTNKRILDVNEHACKISGYTREEMLHMSISDIEVKETPKETDQHLKAFLETGYDRFETQHRTKDGRIIDVEISTTIWSSGDEFLIFAFLRDITAAKKIVEHEKARDLALAAEQGKNIFLRNISHELRTPLNAILGFSQLLVEDPTLTFEHQRQAATIHNNATNLLKILNNLLALTDIETNRSILNQNTLDLFAFLKDLTKRYHSQCEAKGLNMTIALDESLPRYVITDSYKLKTIFENLLDNSLKYTRIGTVAVKVWTEAVEANVSFGEDTFCLLVEIEDTGTGITKEQQKRLFSAYTDLDLNVYRDGPGLGLPISLGYARLMGGNIVFRNMPGGGSCFRFNIFLRRAEEESCKCSIMRCDSGDTDMDATRLANQDDVILTAKAGSNSLSRELIAGLKEALEEGDMIRFERLLVSVSQNHFKLARSLHRLADRFYYQNIETILATLEARHEE